MRVTRTLFIWLPLNIAAALTAITTPPSDAQMVYETAGWGTTAVPLLNFSSDDGTGYGLRANLFEYDGESVPYRRKFSTQVFVTTKGKWVHRILVDTPKLRPGQRLEAELVYRKEDFANYYGGLSDEDIEDYARDEKTFRQAFPELKVKWIRTLRLPWRLRVGGRLSHNDIEPNAARSILSDSPPLGGDGGTFAQLNSSLRYDTRDNYNNATSGILEELLVDIGVGGGGDYRGAMVSFDHRHFLPVAQGQVVVAHHLSIDWTLGNRPFYEELELGGSSTVRGVASARDRGEARVLLNGELRWRGLPVRRRQHIYLGLVAFGDFGQIFERDVLPDGGEWRRGSGMGLRLHWQSTIVRADYGSSSTGRTAIYITFSQVF